MKYTFVTDLRIFIQITDFVQEIYCKNQQRSDAHFEICCKYAQLSDLIVKATAIAVGWCGIIANLIPIPKYFMTGELTTATGNAVPGITADTIMGWMALSLIDGLVTVYGFLVVTSFDGLSLVLFANIRMIAAILSDYLKDFDILLEKWEMTPIKRKRILLNIISMELTYSE